MSDPLMKMTKKWKVKPTKMDRTAHTPAKLEECQFSWNLDEAGVQESNPTFYSQNPTGSPYPSENQRSLSRQQSMPNMKKLMDPTTMMIEKAREQVQRVSIKDNHSHQSAMASSPVKNLTAQLRPLKRHKSLQEVVPAALAQVLRNFASAPSIPVPQSPNLLQFNHTHPELDYSSQYEESSSQDQSPLVRSQSDGAAPSSAMRRPINHSSGENANVPYYTNVNLNGLMSGELLAPSSMGPVIEEQDNLLTSLTSRFHQFQPVNTNNRETNSPSVATAGYCGNPRSPVREEMQH